MIGRILGAQWNEGPPARRVRSMACRGEQKRLHAGPPEPPCCLVDAHVAVVEIEFDSADSHDVSIIAEHALRASHVAEDSEFDEWRYVFVGVDSGSFEVRS